MKPIKFTDLQKQALRDLIQSSAAQGHDFGFTNETAIPAKQMRGILGAIVRKKIIIIHEPVRTEHEKRCVQFEFCEGKLAEMKSILGID